MRVRTVAALALLPLAAGAASPTGDAGSEPALANSAPADIRDPMNLYRERPDCESIPRQVAGQDRDYGATRLGELPPGKLLHAVDREVDGCPVVTFVAEERLRRSSGR